MHHGELYTKLNATESEHILSERSNAIAFEDGDIVNIDLINLEYLKEGFATLVNTGDNEYRFTTIPSITSSYARLKTTLDVHDENAMRDKKVIRDQLNCEYDHLSDEQAMVVKTMISTLGLNGIELGDTLKITVYRPEKQMEPVSITVDQIEKAFGLDEDKYRHLWYIVPLNGNKLEAYNLSALYCFDFINTIDIENELKLDYRAALRKLDRKPATTYASVTTPPLTSASSAEITQEERKAATLTNFLANVLENHNPKIKFTKRGMNNVKADHPRHHKRMR